MKLAFVIPGPIVPWMRPRPCAGKPSKFMNPRRYSEYKQHVSMMAMVALRRAKLCWNTHARFNVELRFFFQDLACRDDDNCEKAIKDGLKRILWHDDSWTHFRRITKWMDLDRNNPRVEIEVERWWGD